MLRHLVPVSALLILAAVTPATVRAQDGTPAPDFVIPNPAECEVAPRSPESIAAALASSLAGTPPNPADLPSGEPAVAATLADVTALARQAAACGNAGDYRRVFALYTDDGLRAFSADRGLTAEQLVGFLAATPVPVPEEARQGVRVREARVLPDGRVTAIIEFRSPAGIGTVLVVLVRQEGRFRVDSEVVVPPATATPAG
jgi:hypothetical protein